jgi:hypothetical protein
MECEKQFKNIFRVAILMCLIDNNIQESITARKVMEDVSDWGQHKKKLKVII